MVKRFCTSPNIKQMLSHLHKKIEYVISCKMLRPIMKSDIQVWRYHNFPKFAANHHAKSLKLYPILHEINGHLTTSARTIGNNKEDWKNEPIEPDILHHAMRSLLLLARTKTYTHALSRIKPYNYIQNYNDTVFPFPFSLIYLS